MNRHLKALELDKILSLLADEASCEDGKTAALELRPAKTASEAKDLLKETDDAYVLVAKFGAPSFYGLKNSNNALRRAEAGGVLSLLDLINIDKTLKTIRGLKSWRSKSEGVKSSLDKFFENLYPNKYAEDRINQTVQNEEEVADTASQELANIRAKIRRASQNVKEQLDKLVRSPHYQKYLQDSIVTQRDGRYVVPVKSEYRNEVKGLVHDSSSSGATLFIEPMAVVEANNEVRVLKNKEADEIERILLLISAEIGTFAESIILSYQCIVRLNLIFAKANLAYKMKASMPLFEDDGKINIKSARHPLIDKDQVVAVDINLGYDFDTLVVTGPNTGGKTVSIKTLGLFCLMAMCGLMVPCSDGSKLSFFSKILVDIGDEQSIEQSLSTFSSHMTNIINILKIADSKSLVLVDELGAGTDPIEGAALATSIIESLRIKRVKLAATTHYAELKEFALKTIGVENACCEFDVKTLSPTYKLLIGVPGKSNAFAISKRLGLSPDITERAKNLVSKNSSDFEIVVQKLEDSRRKMEEEKTAMEKLKLEAQKQLKEAEEIKIRAEKDAKNEIELAKQQANNVVSRTRAQAQALVDEIEKMKKLKINALTESDRVKLRSGMKSLDEKSNPVVEKKAENYVLPRPLKVGDDVLIFDIDKKAVITEINGNTVSVQAGIIKTRVNIKNLRLIDQKHVEKKTNRPRNTATKGVNMEVAKMDIDIRGMTCDEGIMELDGYIDRAVRQNLNQVTIIHGKGTGVLRNAVQAHLKRHPSIRSYRMGVFGEGDMGVTIAELK